MLMVRNEQRAILAQASDRTFVEAVFQHLRRYFTTPGAVQREDIERAIACARALGFDSYQVQWRFVQLAAVAGWGFSERPQLRWIADILTDARITAQRDRLERAFDELRYRITIQAANAALSQIPLAPSSAAARA